MSERSRWQKSLSNMLFMVGIAALATIWGTGSLTWIIVALGIGIVSIAASHLLWPWEARFPRHDRLTPPDTHVRQHKEINGR